MNIKKMLKKAVVFILPIMLLTACGGAAESTAQPTPSDITTKLTADIEFPQMAEVKSDRVKDFYDIDTEQVDAISVFICGSGAYPDEIAIFKMKSADQTAAVKTAIEARITKLTANFKDYAPDEMYKIEGAKTIVKGNYAILLVCKDNDKAEEIVNSYF